MNPKEHTVSGFAKTQTATPPLSPMTEGSCTAQSSAASTTTTTSATWIIKKGIEEKNR
jgi:hypothetical protein